MSFESFIRLAEKNQAKNDKQVEKLAVELKQKQEMLRREYIAAQKANSIERSSLRKASNNFSSQKLVANPQPTPYVPQPTSHGPQSTSHGPQPTPYVPQKRSMVDSSPLEDSEMSSTPNEYVPSAPKRPRSPSNLMEALGVMTSTGLSDDKLQKPQYVPKIPRIPRKNSEQPIKATLVPTRSPGPTPNRSDEERPCRTPSVERSNQQKSLYKVTSKDRTNNLPKSGVKMSQPVTPNPSKLPNHQQPKSVSGLSHQRPVPYLVTSTPTVEKTVAYKPTPISIPKSENSGSSKTTAYVPSKSNEQHKSSVINPKANSLAARPAVSSNKTQEGLHKSSISIPKTNSLTTRPAVSSNKNQESLQKSSIGTHKSSTLATRPSVSPSKTQEGLHKSSLSIHKSNTLAARPSLSSNKTQESLHKSSISIQKSTSLAARPSLSSNRTQDDPSKLSNKIPKNGGIAAQLGTSKITVPKTGQSLLSKISSVKTQQPPKGPTGIAAQLSSKALPGLEKRSRTPDVIAPHRANSSPAFSKDRTPSTCTSRPSKSGATMEKSSKLPTKQNGSLSHSELSTMSKKTTVHRVLKPSDEKPLSTKSCLPSSQKPNLPDHRVKSQLPSHSARGIAAQQGAPVCGIAAQFGSLPLQTSRARSPDDYSCDEGDDYASDDSFIDDSESMDAKDYSRFVKVIHKTLNFDPKRYANVSRYDDLSSMESNFRQIEKEERISARLGAKEDEEDIAAEAARRERRRHKLAA